MAYFEQIGAIAYEGPKSKNPLSFKYYNPAEVISGKSMKDHLRFAMSWWQHVYLSRKRSLRQRYHLPSVGRNRRRHRPRKSACTRGV